MRSIAICTTAAVTGVALQTSIQTHNFIQNWTKDAHTTWAIQAQIDDIQEEIQELKTAIMRVGDQLTDVQKPVMLKCDWNSTQFYVTPVFISIIMPITGNKSNFIYKTYIIMSLWMYNYYKKKYLKPFLIICLLSLIWKL